MFNIFPTKKRKEAWGIFSSIGIREAFGNLAGETVEFEERILDFIKAVDFGGYAYELVKV